MPTTKSTSAKDPLAVYAAAIDEGRAPGRPATSDALTGPYQLHEPQTGPTFTAAESAHKGHSTHLTNVGRDPITNEWMYVVYCETCGVYPDAGHEFEVPKNLGLF